MDRSRLSTINLSLCDKLSARGRCIPDLDRFTVVKADVSFRLPLVLILIEPVKVSRCIVQKHTLRRQTVKHFWRLKLVDRLQQAPFLLSIDHVNLLLTYRAKVHQELHAKATCEKRFVRRFAHFKEKLDALVFALPR